MIDSDRRPLSASLSACTFVGLCVGLIGGAIDGVHAAQAAEAGSPLLLGVALNAPAGVLLGAFIGLVIGGVWSALPAGETAWSLLRERPDIDRRVVALSLTAGVCALLEAVVVHAFFVGPAASMARRSLAALSTALVAAATVVVAALMAAALYRMMLPAARLVPRIKGLPATGVALGGGAVLGVGVGGWVLSGIDWRVLRFAPWVTLGLEGLSIALGGWFLVRKGGVWHRLRWLAAALLFGGGLALLSPSIGSDANNVAVAQQHGWLLPRLLSAGRALGDRDGDGFSSWFGGGDCDDGDAAVNPAARDIPGNGIDENCQGGDAKPPKRRRSRPRPASRPAAPQLRGVLLVCIDTLRADVLGVAGNDRGLTPNLDRLARRSTYFSNAHAQAANTPQSFPSIFTSLYPPRVPYRKRFTGYPVILPEADTVFELLQRSGFHTAAVSSHFYFQERRGIRQGFDEWDNRGATNIKKSNKDIASPRIIPRAIAKLRALAAGKQRFALFVHLFEPHSTYVKHPGFKYDKHGVAGLRQKYGLEVKFADRWLGKLLEAAADAGLGEKLAIVVFADHGEAFGEHRFYFHGQALYEEVLRVPLILHVPGIEPRVVSRRVPLLDIAPTLLELAGASVPQSFQGESLLPLARGKGASDPRPIGAALLRYPAWPKGQRVVISGKYKALMRTTENRFEVYDLSSDPHEQHNLALRDPELTKRMRATYTQFVEQQMQR